MNTVTSMAADKISLRVPSSIGNISMVEKFIDEAKLRWSIADELYGNIMIAITEAVNNAIIHGNKQDEKKLVYLEIENDNGKYRFIVEDQGKGFNYENIKDPTAPENLLEPGGRGIFLMRELSNEIRFEKDGSRVELIFKV